MAVKFDSVSNIDPVLKFLDFDDNCERDELNVTKYIDTAEINSFFKEKNPSTLNMLHINVRSLNKHYDDILTLLENCSIKLTVLGVTETWLSDSNQELYNISGYNFVTQSRVNKPGGGVGMYINENLNYLVRNDLSNNLPHIESLFVEICYTNASNILVGCIYRPPNTDVALFNDVIQSVLSKSTKFRTAFLMGDFNLDLLNIENNTHTPTANFLNNLCSYSFQPCITIPTRVTETTSTLIDNFFVKGRNLFIKTAAIYSDIADHYPIMLQCYGEKITIRPPKFSIKRNYDSISINSFCYALGEHDTWNDVYNTITNTHDVNAAMHIFEKTYQQKFNSYFPEKRCSTRRKNVPRMPWMTPALVKSSKKKAKLFKRYKKSGTPEAKIVYVTYLNIYKKCLVSAKKNHYDAKFKLVTNSLKKIWSLLNSLIKKKSVYDVIQSFGINGIETKDCSVIANALNDYFVGIGPELDNKIPPAIKHYSAYLKCNQPNSFVLSTTSPSEILNIISDLNNKMSFGSDNIPLSIMKSSAVEVAIPLSEIINLSLSSGCFPNSLKVAKVCPLFKNGAKNDVRNYRPISVLTSFSKVFEKVVFNRLNSFCDKNNILNDSQYGFRKKHSSYMALLDLYNRIAESRENKEHAIGIFIDLSKAFDTINHNILIDKLYKYGVRGVVKDWFRSYLSDRKQYVIYNGKTSLLRDVVCGVPQGSVLGPLLFLLYINDILNCSKLLKFILFADDTNLFYSNKDINTLINVVNTELRNLAEWFRANRLSLNINKTHYIFFSHKLLPSNLSICIDDIVLEKVASTKFLGIIIDSKCTWRAHATAVTLKLARGIGVLNLVKHILSTKTLLMLYYSMLYPHIYYCLIVWGCAAESVLHCLRVVQKRAIRLICNAEYNAHTQPLFARLNLLTINDVFLLQTAMFMGKVKFKMLPLKCLNYFIISNAICYGRRAVSYFKIPTAHSLFKSRCISVRGPTLWDALPPLIVNSSSLFELKHAIFNYAIMQYH